MPLNNIVIPDTPPTEEPDALLKELLRRGNRIALLEEVYRRANKKPSAYDFAKKQSVDTENTKRVADIAEEKYLPVEDTERIAILEQAYGEIVDYMEKHHT